MANDDFEHIDIEDEVNFDDVDLTPVHEILEMAPKSLGRTWTYLAMHPGSKFILTYLIGPRNYENTHAFAHAINKTLKRDEEGQLTRKPTLVTDGMPAYEGAFEEVFHAEVDYAQYIKKYSKEKGKKGRFDGADRRKVVGDPPETWINTTYVERQNLNLRMGNRRFTRRSNAFSKQLLDHKRHTALWIVYHDFGWEPRPMRPAAGSPKGTPWIKRGTAANEIGFDQTVWEMTDFLRHIDNHTQKVRAANDNEPSRATEAADSVVDDVDVQLVPSYWVYLNHLQHSAKVHRADCTNCRDGQGRHGGSRPGSAEWRPFYSEAAALTEAERMAPERNSICSMCLGEYRSKVWKGH